MNYLVDQRAAWNKRKPGVLEVYYAVKSEFATIAVPDYTVGATPPEKVVINDAHTFTDEGNGFRKIQITAQKTEATFESIGDIDSKSILAKLEFFRAGIDSRIAGLLLEDEEFIILIPNGPCGTSEFLQLGSACSGAKITKSESKTGKYQATEAKGTTITMEANQDFITFYNAAIPLAE